ncbi:hypothetical protein L210DRAFT_952116 [Boletus edulis BED1]|uniref:Uncharacterized protein n=1 Tax=Boletus edulis BED1 TaxID=1328754 RepID=A0AAD4BNK0_BOLED|nr:hypothetical protein L210DRAFT_952116 [Boletus edulis BED1]
MPASEFQGPLDFPSLPSLPYNVPEGQLPALARAHSQPIESSQGPSYGRRTQSEGSLNVPVPVPMLRTPPVADNAASEQPASVPSPVPTEIIPPDLTQEEIVIDIQQMGIKVRDFAYEAFPVELRAPELFDPILGWDCYEAVLDNPSPKRSPLNGKQLRRLLDLGWVSEAVDGYRWEEKDREALEKFDSRPHHPWKALSLTKPKTHDLRDVATSRFQWVNAEHLALQFVNRGFSRVAGVLRGSRQASEQYQKRQANDATAREKDPEVPPRLKKRRLSIGAESTASGSQHAPSPSAQFPLTLVDGKPPQQFPAGHPSDRPPRLSPLPTQGALGRSLQPHLSVMTTSSPDPRTTLTQSTNFE